MQLSSEQQAKIDRLGECQRQIALVKPIADEASEISHEIQQWFAREDPEESFAPAGKLYRAIVGPRARKRNVTEKKKLFRALGQQKFIESCSISLATLEKLLADITPFVSEDRSGARSVRTVLREAVIGSNKAAA